MAEGLSLRWRLSGAFVVVAVAATAALALVMVLATRSETGRLSGAERERSAARVVERLARSYRAAGSWGAADLTSALMLARQADGVLVVRDERGAVVMSDRPGRGRQAGRGRGLTTVERAIEVAGRRAGTAELGFHGGLTRAEALLRDNLVRATVIGSA